RTMIEEENVRKNYYDGGAAPMYSLSSDRAWDGKIDGKQAPEGQYYLKVEGAIDFDGAEKQTLELPVILDVTAPELDATFDEEAQKVHVEASDDGRGLAYSNILVDGKSVLDETYTNGETEHQLFKSLDPDQTLTVESVKYTVNLFEEEARESEDTT